MEAPYPTMTRAEDVMPREFCELPEPEVDTSEQREPGAAEAAADADPTAPRNDTEHKTPAWSHNGPTYKR